MLSRRGHRLSRFRKINAACASVCVSVFFFRDKVVPEAMENQEYSY